MVDVRDTLAPRYDSVFIGEVVDTRDKLHIGRVKVLVPGLLEPGAWALPLGMMLGVKNGFFFVPEVESNVAVFFHQGDVDFPCYMPGNFGKRGGIQEIPEQAPLGNPDVGVIRWKGFAITFDGRANNEFLTIEDVETGTKIKIDRQTKDLTETIKGSKNSLISKDRTVNVAGDQTEIIAGNKSTTVAKDVTNTVAGNSSKTVVGNDSETVTGAKSIAAASIALTATGNVALSTAGNLALGGSSVSIIGTGAGTESHLGLKKETFLGGLIKSITGDFTINVSGILRYAVSGILEIVGSQINLGDGPYLPLLNKNFHDNTFANHTHSDPVSGQTGPAVFSVDPADLTTNTKAS